jgi:hypothetical protein
VVAYLGGVWGHWEAANASLFRAKVEMQVIGRVEAMHSSGLGKASEDFGLVPQLAEDFVRLSGWWFFGYFAEGAG